jgi:hypothetical protein
MDFSPVIFWDVDVANIDWQKRSRFVISRVVQYGTVDDWRKVKNLYGLEKIKMEMVEERNLDNRSLSFLSCVLGVPKEKFRCFITSQSHPTQVNF